jgi:hypothetical protein
MGVKMEVGFRRYTPAFVEDLAHQLVRKLGVLGESICHNAQGFKKLLTEHAR